MCMLYQDKTQILKQHLHVYLTIRNIPGLERLNTIYLASVPLQPAWHFLIQA